jgi:hypothetical protein
MSKNAWAFVIFIGLVIVANVVIRNTPTSGTVTTRVSTEIIKPVDPDSADESQEYIDAMRRTAWAANMKSGDFRDRIRALSHTCNRSKIEIYRYVKAMAHQIGMSEMESILESTPAICAQADKMDRPLIAPGPL